MDRVAGSVKGLVGVLAGAGPAGVRTDPAGILTGLPPIAADADLLVAWLAI